jgi:hypothetical protein
MRFLEYFRAIATGEDSGHVQRRREIALPALTAKEISLVGDQSVCAGLMPLYEAETEMRDANTGSVIAGSGQLYVLRAGPVYLATDSRKKMGEWGLLVVFDEMRRVLFRGLY